MLQIVLYYQKHAELNRNILMGCEGSDKSTADYQVVSAHIPEGLCVLPI